MADLKDNRFKDQSAENKTKNYTNDASQPEPAIIPAIHLPSSMRQATQRVYTITCDSNEPASPLSIQESSPEYASSSNSSQPLRSHDTSKLAKPCIKELVMKESDLRKIVSYVPHTCYLRGCNDLFSRKDVMDHYTSRHALRTISGPAEVWSGEYVKFHVNIDHIKEGEDTIVGVFAYAGSRNGRKPAERFVSEPNRHLDLCYKDWASNILVLLFARRQPLVPNSKCTANVYVFHLAALPSYLSLTASINVYNESAPQLFGGTLNVDELLPPSPSFYKPLPEEDKLFVVHQVHMDKLVEGPCNTVKMLLSIGELLQPNEKPSLFREYKFIENINRNKRLGEMFVPPYAATEYD